jgi:signal transduction histidine kinase
MKRSINSMYHLVITILLALVLFESLLLLIISTRAKDLMSLANDLQTAIIVFVFVIFAYAIVIYNYIPLRIKKSLKLVDKTISEISHGNYDMDIDTESFAEDKEVQSLLLGIKTMLRSVQGFDQAKELKIHEHDQRLKQLINLLSQGALIALSNGDVSYCNDALRRKYPILNEVRNINDLNLKADFDRKIFDKISDALRFGDNIYDAKIPDIDYKQQALINGSVVRNIKGDPIGGVFILSFTENVK